MLRPQIHYIKFINALICYTFKQSFRTQGDNVSALGTRSGTQPCHAGTQRCLCANRGAGNEETESFVMTFCLCFAMGTVSRDFNWFMSFAPFHIVPQCSTYSLAPFHIVVHIVHIVSQLPGIFSRFRRSRSQPGGQFLCVAVAYQKLKSAILMYKPELAGFSRCETMGPCSIPNSKPKTINGFSCVARSILYHFKLKILKRRVADRHISISAEFFVKFRQKTLTASRRQVTGEQALPRLDSSEVAA